MEFSKQRLKKKLFGPEVQTSALFVCQCTAGDSVFTLHLFMFENHLSPFKIRQLFIQDFLEEQNQGDECTAHKPEFIVSFTGETDSYLVLEAGTQQSQ